MEMLSLYDYLGKAAGEKLGKEVWEVAAQASIKTEMREVSNPKYTGKVENLTITIIAYRI